MTASASGSRRAGSGAACLRSTTTMPTAATNSKTQIEMMTSWRRAFMEGGSVQCRSASGTGHPAGLRLRALGSHSKCLQVKSYVVPNDSIRWGFESCGAAPGAGTGKRVGRGVVRDLASGIVMRQGGVLSSLWSPRRRFSFRSAAGAVWLEAALVGWRSSAGRASDL